MAPLSKIAGRSIARACAALLLPTLYLLSVPLNVLAQNLHGLTIAEQNVWAMLGLYMVTGVIFVLVFSFAPRFRVLGWAAKALARVSVIVFVWMMAGTIFKNYGASIRGALISEVLIALILTAAMFRVRFDVLCMLLAPLTAAQILLSIGVGVPVLLDLHRLPVAASTTAPPAVAKTVPDTATSHKRNVYHIIVDSFQDEAYSKLTHDKPELDLKELQHYTPFVSNYPWTSWITRTLVAGRYLDNGMSATKWNLNTSLWKDLTDNGVAVSVYTYIPFADYSNVTHLRTLEQYRKEYLAPSSLRWLTRYDPSILSWVDLIFLNAAPVCVRNYVNRDFHPVHTKSIVGYGFSITQYFNKASVNLEHLPFFSIGLFHEMLHDELTRPATGQYVFFHLVLPHPPDVIDENLNYLGPNSGQSQGYPGSMAMHEAALKLIRQLIDVLHQTGHFDGSTIIVHGDHGRWWAFPEALEPYVDPRAPIKVGCKPDVEDAPTSDPNDRALQAVGLASRTAALLLAKLGGVPNPKPVDGCVQTIDISATILRHFGLNDPQFTGVPLQDPAGIHDRPAITFFVESPSSLHTVLPKFALHDRRFVFKEDVPIR